MSQAHKVCLVSGDVILTRFLNVWQRAHKDVRESEHTQGLQTSSGRFLAADRNEVKIVSRAVAGAANTLANLVRSTPSELSRP